MVPTYPENTDVAVVVDFPQIDGASITPTAIGYIVMDERGTVVRAREEAIADGETVSVVIPASANALPATGVIRGLRSVRFVFTTDAGTYTADKRYIIETANKLIPMFNSFQTYEEAVVTRLDLPDLDGWDVATEENHIPALITAHDRMCRASFRYRLAQNSVEYDEKQMYWYINSMRERTPQDFADFPVNFQIALRRAQIYEADSILSGDPVGDKRLDGVVSETIGEAKMFFNNKPPIRTPMCRKAMEVLAPYLYRANRIGRA